MLPLEKMTVARSSSLASFARPSERSSRPVGRSHALSKAQSFSPQPGLAATSSSSTVSTGTLSLILSRKTREVSTVLIPHWRMHEASVSSETV